MKFLFALLFSCLVNMLLVDGRRLMNSVVNSAGRKCTINEITSRSVDDFCSELSEIMDFRTQMSEIKKSLAEISSTLDVLSVAASTTTEPTEINQDCKGVWSPCSSSCELAGNRTFQMIHPQLGTGRPCPDASDCLSGEDECVERSENISLEVSVTGATEGNKDQICVSIASALSGVPTHCSLEGSQPARRRLTGETLLYINVAVNDASSAKSQAAALDFVSSLTELPEGVAVTDVSIPDANTMIEDHSSSKASFWWLAVLITVFVVTCACVIFLDVMYRNKNAPVVEIPQDGDDSTRGTRFPCNLNLYE